MPPRDRCSLAVRFVTLALALAVPAAAGVPSPVNSTVPPWFIGSPDGSSIGTVIVRDIANNTILGSSVVLDFSDCTAFHPCPSACTSCSTNTVARTVKKVTDATGTAAFDLRVGGSGCPNPPNVRVFADGVFLATVRFASLDQDGDLSVTSADVGIVQSLLASSDLRADFDGDGVVTTADVAIVQAKVGATCDPATPVRRSSWGGLKSIYR